MKKQKLTRADITQTIRFCYDLADSQAEFYYLLEEEGLTLHVEQGKVQGLILDGNEMSFSDFGYTEHSIESIEPSVLTAQDMAMVYGEPLREYKDYKEEPYPGQFALYELEEKFRREEMRNREDEMEKLRGKEGEKKEIELDF